MYSKQFLTKIYRQNFSKQEFERQKIKRDKYLNGFKLYKMLIYYFVFR